MSIHELLAKFDAKDLRVHYMDQSIAKIDATTRKARVTFETDALSPGSLANDSHPVGILVWIPRDKWKEKTAR